MKSKIEEILYKHSERVGLYEGGIITCVDENEFEEIAQEIVKLFAIPRVIKSVCENCGKDEAVICQSCYDVETQFRECY